MLVRGGGLLVEYPNQARFQRGSPGLQDFIRIIRKNNILTRTRYERSVAERVVNVNRYAFIKNGNLRSITHSDMGSFLMANRSCCSTARVYNS